MYVDAVMPERREHFSTDAGVLLHPIADQGENREAALDFQRVDLADIYLILELAIDNPFGKIGGFLIYRNANRMLGRALRNKDYVDLRT